MFMIISKKIVAIIMVFWLSSLSFGHNFDEFLNAIKTGNIQLIENIINSGFDINQKDDKGNTPLHYAARDKSKEAIRILVEHGANIDAVNKLKCTPLHFAILNNNIVEAKLLLAIGADLNMVDIDGFANLHHAASVGDIRLAQLLVLIGANANAVNRFNENALQVARRRGYKKCAQELEKIIYEVMEMSDEQRKSLAKKAFADIYVFLGVKNK